MIIDNHQVRPWTITWQGQTWNDDEVPFTAADLCVLQVMVGDGWASANPWASPLHLVSMIALLAARTASVEPLELLALVQQTPADEFIGAIVVRAVAPSPLAEE